MHTHILEILEVVGAALEERDLHIQSLQYQIKELEAERDRYKQVYEEIRQEAKGKCK